MHDRATPGAFSCIPLMNLHITALLQEACPRADSRELDPGMSDDFDPTRETRALFVEVAPERTARIDELLQDVQYEIASDRPAMHLEATAILGKGLVVFTNRALQQVWLISYLAWRTLHEQSGFVIVALIKKLPYDLLIMRVEGDEYTDRVDRLGEALAALRNAEDSLPWPDDVPKLTPDLSTLQDEEDVAAYDLARFACTFILLHETCHALKRIDSTPETGIEEEIECDRFAIDFLLSGCDKYAEQHGYDKVKVRRKRSMGVFLGLAVIFESTEYGLWSPSETHPSIYMRLRLVFNAVDPLMPDPDDPVWVYACCMLLSKMRRDRKLPGTIPFTSCRGLFLAILELLKS